MADEATLPAGTGASQSVPAPTQVVADAAAVQSEIPELTPEAAAAGFTADDFKHPQYGVKAKNLYRGFQKVSEEAAKHRKDMETVNHRLTSMYQTDPEVKRAIDAYVRKESGEASSDETPEPGQELKGVQDQMAFGQFYAHLGGGDPVKGQELFQNEQGEYRQVFDSFYGKGDMLRALMAAKELITLRRAQATKAATPDPKLEVAATGESGRGTNQNPADGHAKSIEDAANRFARQNGFADYNAWSHATFD